MNSSEYFEAYFKNLTEFNDNDTSLQNQIEFCNLHERLIPMFRSIKSSLVELQTIKRKQFEKLSNK